MEALQTAPTVTISAATNITATTATIGGNVTDDGGVTVSSRGICWSTNLNPTISDSKTSNSTGTGSFSSSLTGLTQGATYYLKAYAINSIGTAYSSQTTFTTALPVATPVVYVIGNHQANQNNGDFWINGVSVKLTTNIISYFFPSSLYVSGSDSYVVGSGGNYNSSGIPLLYKNGESIDITSYRLTQIVSVFVSGSDLYILGVSSDILAVWKNGSIINTLPHDPFNSAGTSILISGTDVYVIGRNNNRPSMWKNGNLTYLSDFVGVANSVFVSGLNVYVVGKIIKTQPIIYEYPVIWKNGVMSYLSNFEGVANSVFVSGSDVYIAGETYTADNTGLKGFQWKNGNQTPLPLSEAKSIYVIGSDVYIAGSSNDGYPAVCTNGVIKTLSAFSGKAVSIFVKK